MKRLLCALLAAALLLAPMPAASASSAQATYNDIAYDTNYLTWMQTDDAWGQESLGTLCTIASSGCLLTSMSILMCLSGVYDSAEFNPGVLRDYLESAGLISHSSYKSGDGNINLESLTNENLPRFSYVGYQTCSSWDVSAIGETVQALMADGYCVIAMVRSGHHYVALTGVSGGDVTICDPYYDADTLSDWSGTISGLLVFLPNTAGADVIGCRTDDDILSYRVSQSNVDSYFTAAVETDLCYAPATGASSGTAAASGTVLYLSDCGYNEAGELWYRVGSGAYTALYLPGDAVAALDTGYGGYAPSVTVLSLGDDGDGVSWLQYCLSVLGYDVEVDGSYSTGTEAAVEQFQSNCGLTVDGAAGARTTLAVIAQMETLSQTGDDLVGDASGFSDLEESDWYYTAAAALETAGVLTGAELGDGGTLDGDTAESRGNAVWYMYRLYTALGGSVSSASETPFSDVETDAREDAVVWAYACGIVSGYGDGTFGPDDNLTREQFCKILVRFAAYAGISLPQIADGTAFTDAADIQSWAADGVEACRAAGLVSGYDDGSFRPRDSITRAEVLTVLYRLLCLTNA